MKSVKVKLSIIPESLYSSIKISDDSISSVLKQLVNAHIFESEDKVSLIDDSYIIKMDGYPKDGPIAKAIVYFLMSKLNNIYELWINKQ